MIVAATSILLGSIPMLPPSPVGIDERLARLVQVRIYDSNTKRAWDEAGSPVPYSARESHSISRPDGPAPKVLSLLVDVRGNEQIETHWFPKGLTFSFVFMDRRSGAPDGFTRWSIVVPIPDPSVPDAMRFDKDWTFPLALSDYKPLATFRVQGRRMSKLDGVNLSVKSSEGPEGARFSFGNFGEFAGDSIRTQVISTRGNPWTPHSTTKQGPDLAVEATFAMSLKEVHEVRVLHRKFAMIPMPPLATAPRPAL